MTSLRTTSTAAVLVFGLLGSACGGGGDSKQVIDVGDGGEYAPTTTAADFVEGITNPFLPLVPGSKWVYEGVEDGETERVEVVVTDERKEILGISATVVRDTVTVDGELVEDTFDWFAQDRDGNVWYLGEDSKEYEDGTFVGTKGSWEAGVDGARPGIVMPAAPKVGRAYRQEFFKGEAEDMAEVVGLDGTATVPFGAFDELVVIKEWTPLEPDVVEEKLYASGVGVVLERKTTGGKGRVELLSYTGGART